MLQNIIETAADTTEGSLVGNGSDCDEGDNGVGIEVQEGMELPI